MKELTCKPCKLCGQPVSRTRRKDRAAWHYPDRCGICAGIIVLTDSAKIRRDEGLKKARIIKTRPVGSKRLVANKNVNYIKIKIAEPNVWEFEHRYVMKKHIGRLLTKTEHIHHKDGNGTNNSIENLEIVSHIEHTKLHATERKLVNPWAKKHSCCINCQTTNFKHVCRGLCRSCYFKTERVKHNDRFRAYDAKKWQNKKDAYNAKRRHRRTIQLASKTKVPYIANSTS